MSEPKDILISEIVLTSEQLKAVGCLAIESTRLETHVEQVILEHFGSEFGGFLVEGKTSIAYKVALFKAAFVREAIDAEHAKELELLCGDITSDISKRNTVIHGSWEETVSLADLLKFTDPSRDAAVYKKSMKMNASEVMDLAYRFGHHQIRLVQWYFEIKEHKNALRDKP